MVDAALKSATATDERRFHIYNVGIAKTGTTSLGLLFKRYRSGHEFMFQESVEHIVAWQDKTISEREFRDFVLYRDKQGSLEMDSASFNHNYLHILLEEFPEAKFVFTIRDCYSWLNSILNMSASFGTSTPVWMQKYGRSFGIEVQDGDLNSVDGALRKGPERVEPLLRYWGESNKRILGLLPERKTLILRTREISSSLEELGQFSGIPPSTLITGLRHSNRGAGEIDFLKIFDRGYLEDLTSAHCGELMQRWFPEVTLDAFV